PMSQQQQQTQPAQARGHAPVEPEQCLILRLPQPAADKLRGDIESGAQLQDRLSLEARQDLRSFTLTYDGETLPGRLVDLPCIVEGLKTADSRTFYKVANITQMLMCGEDAASALQTLQRSSGSRRRRSASASATVTATAEERMHQWDHGLTPPLRNVRRRRFRRVLRNRSMDMPELEKEVKRLLKNDMEAADVKWEVLTEEEASKLDSASSQQQQSQPSEQPAGSSQTVDDGSNNLMMATQLFGDISDSTSSGDNEGDDSDDEEGEGEAGDGDGEGGDDGADDAAEKADDIDMEED
ncbi:hypothetical protein BOX15_Mlig026986g7, partial [Macrostomum lignano]